MIRETYRFEYKVTTTNEDINWGNEIRYGITFAETYTEAMNYIENYYGDELVDVTLYSLDAGHIYEFESDKAESPLLKNV